ncbi:NADH-quinone oxidoreductase subunit C [Methanoculleus sp. FWC-SCC1]|uniref:NADH-quinone oxidoreductase subunit C n=1 Tax=Methanoculleus frigidifontis TaxID=2584085 RepID=A0ABT8MD59_9EURY|nr:NADH-quinone oxidoreductase subunit C [Methanoculleus sp. FWC-SCC1]MDN7025866.1 NADH-quinone oxidoreductase subunit C [Methanoculleus sp. FWC-SCC1]
MKPAKLLTPEEVVAVFAKKFGKGILESRITERCEGVGKRPSYDIWLDIDRDTLHPAVRELIAIHFPHLGVISGTDIGDAVELNYHFSIYYGTKHGEYMVTLTVALPKSDLRVATIADLIPGAVFSEREKQEMLGVEVVGIPDGRRLFLPEEFPEGVYPWRKDETGIRDGMVKDLWAVGRPANRPARPAIPPEEEGVVQAAEVAEAKVTAREPAPAEEERHE